MTKNIYRTFAREQKLEQDIEELEKKVFEQEQEKKEEEELRTPDLGLDPEEKTFKKRYSDLRSHSQKLMNEAAKREQDLEARLRALETQLDQAQKKQIKYPSTEEELEDWAQRYPDVFRNFKTLAMKLIREDRDDIDKQFKLLEEEKKKASRDLAYKKLLNYHSDFEDIRDSDEFKDWIMKQPKPVQDTLYKNETDAEAAAFTIDAYKNFLEKKAPKKDKNSDTREAARGIRTLPSESPEDKNRLKFTEKTLQRMSLKDIERFEKEIEEAMKDPRFYDLSGGAR